MRQGEQGFNWRIERGKVILADRLRVVPQRSFREDWTGESDCPPRSYGVAPIGIAADEAAGDEVIVAVPESEVSWLGLEAVDRHVPSLVRIFLSSIYRSRDLRITDEDARGVWFENSNFASPPAFAVKGIHARTAWHPFARPERPGSPILERIAVTVEAPGDAKTGPSRSAANPLSRLNLAFVEPRMFLKLTGVGDLESLRRSQGYRDRLLP